MVRDARGRQLLSWMCQDQMTDRIEGEERWAIVRFMQWAGFHVVRLFDNKGRAQSLIFFLPVTLMNRVS